MGHDDLGRYAAKHQRNRKAKKRDKARKRKDAFIRAGGGSPSPSSPKPATKLHGLRGRAALGRPTRGIVSVLMSAYRSDRWIREAANSILSQKLPWGWRLELLIGVDACRATKRHALALRDPRVVVIEMAENVGTYQTLNALLDHAQGSLVAVMDSDDLSRPGRLATGIVAMEADARLGLVAGHYQNCDEGLRPVGDPTARICHGAMLVRRKLYDLLGGYKPWRCGADWDFFARVEKTRYTTILQAHTFLLRRIHPGSLCQASATRPQSPAREFAFTQIEKEKARAQPTVVRREPPQHAVLSDQRPSFSRGVGVVLPTVPRREETAKAVVRTLLRQGVDIVHVHLNGYASKPEWARGRRVRAFLHPRGTGPLVRFTQLPDTEFVLSVDDDIVYPSDYVERTVAQLKARGPGVGLSYHGSWWDKTAPPAYSSRNTITYEEGREAPRSIVYGGSGVAAFHGRDLWFMEAEAAPPLYQMEDDVWVSAAAARTGVRLLRPPSPERWLRSTEAGHVGLYTQAKANGFRRRDAAIAAALDLGVWKVGRGAVSRPAPARPRRSKPQGFGEQAFWAARYEQTGDSILTVGRRDASTATNQSEYARAIRQFQEMVRSDFDDPSSISVLDVGYGLGHYARALAELGVTDYVGIDFASAAAPDDLVKRGFRFRQGVDASEPRLDLGRTFDLVVVIDVIFHIVADARFASATSNLKRHASGLLYITGLFQDRKLAPHVRHRSAPRFGLGAPETMERWRDNKIARFRVSG